MSFGLIVFKDFIPTSVNAEYIISHIDHSSASPRKKKMKNTSKQQVSLTAEFARRRFVSVTWFEYLSLAVNKTRYFR